MANETETVTLEILAKDLASGNVGKFVAGLDNMAKKGGLVGSVVQGVGLSLGTMLNPLGLVSQGIGMVGDALAGSIQAFGESQVIQAQTEAVLKSTAGAAGVTADEIGNLASAVSQYSGQDDEAIQKGENLLLTFTGIKNAAGEGNDVFDQTTRIMVDMAQAMGTDASGQAVRLGKALQDPIHGVTALTKAGVNFTAEQKAQIRAMQQSGDLIGAQKLVLAELNKEFGGSAEAFGNTLPGAVAKFDTAMGNLGEEVGGIVAGPLTDLVETLDHIIGGTPDATGAIGDYEKKLRDMADAAEVAAGKTDALVDSMPQSGDKSILGLIAIDEHMDDLFSLLGSKGATVDAWANSMQDLGDQVGFSSDELDHYVQLSMDAGQTYDQTRAALADLVDQQKNHTEATQVDTAAQGDQQKAMVRTGNVVENQAAKIAAAAQTERHALHSVAVGAKGMLDDIEADAKQATKDLQWTIRNSGKLAKEHATLQKQISREMRTGLKSDNAFVQRQVATNVSNLIGDLGRLEGVAVDTGETLQWVIDVMSGTDAAKSNAMQQLASLYAQLPKPKGHARGGHMDAGEVGIVGEQGMELWVPDTPGTVVPGHLGRAGRGQGLQVHVHFESAYPPSPREGARIAEAIAPHLQREFTRLGF